MIQVRKNSARGEVDAGWLKSFHTFSFGEYHDPNEMGFRQLRVINEDRVAPSEGFETHSHRDMEILTYVLSGNLSHKDSMGNGSQIVAGDLQYMSAGSGVQHSEFNNDPNDTCHFFQIWILPATKGGAPSYDQRSFSESDKMGKLCLLASGDGASGSVRIKQDVKLYASVLKAGQMLELGLPKNRFAWIQMAKGKIKVNGTELVTSDGARISPDNGETTTLKIEGLDGKSEFLLFDLY